MAAEGEEVVVGADRVQAEDVGEQGAQGGFQRGGRGAAGDHRHLGRREGTLVDLAVRGERQPVQPDDHRRDQVVGQGRGQFGAQRGRIDVTGHVTGQADHRAGHRQDGRAGHPGQRGQGGLDLAELHPEAADLHLLVGAAHVLDLAVRADRDQVAGTVHAVAGVAVRVGHEPLGGQRRPAPVAAGQRRPGQVQLADHTGRHGLEPGVEDVRAGVLQRGADRDGGGIPEVGHGVALPANGEQFR
ncbi:hypothetical protein GCM10009531_53940 [Actinoplanes capillaceus]